MHRIGLSTARRVLALALLALTLSALLAGAAGAARVTVRIEGASRTRLAPTVVTIGTGTSNARTWNGSGSLPNTCADDTAYQAIELATSGSWDRGLYAEQILSETHTFASGSEYWIPYHDNNYADWGICDLHLQDGDTLLMQAGVSGASPSYIPDSVPIALARIGTGNIAPGGRLTVRLTAWVPSDIFGTQDPGDPNHYIIPPSDETHPAGYTVTAGSASGRTDSNGEVTLTMRDTGRVSVQANMPGSSTNWSRSVPFTVCVSRTSC
ncbi:MAG TPA: hypothetical protein VKB03_03115 [Conexibacter sp.]|nr:hypothetical protein [Conexibacter sp.]